MHIIAPRHIPLHSLQYRCFRNVSDTTNHFSPCRSPCRLTRNAMKDERIRTPACVNLKLRHLHAAIGWRLD